MWLFISFFVENKMTKLIFLFSLLLMKNFSYFSLVIEIACSIIKLAKSITIISRTDVPYSRTLGRRIGAAIKKVLISKNIRFLCTGSSSPLEFVLDEESNRLIRIKSPEFAKHIECDVCVIGIGSVPNTEFLRESSSSNIKLSDNNCIIVDENFQTSVPNVYAGGDVCVYPNHIFDDQMMNIAHWQTAQAHGRQASLAMMNRLAPLETRFQSVTFFWSAIFGKGIRFAGIVNDPDDCLIDGDIIDLHFVAYYFRDDRVIGVATIGRDPLASAFAALLRDNKILTKQDIE